MKDKLRTVIEDQHLEKTRNDWVPRAFPRTYADRPDIMVISGVRRCGKSVMLQQIRATQPERDYFLNFDDERLFDFTVEHFQLLHEVLIERFGVQRTFYFDEIQNVPGWERFVRRLHDAGNKVFLTGSNAIMLSRELGTRLTGRYCRYELYPFSFAEYLAFVGCKLPKQGVRDTALRARVSGHFRDYLEKGGLPTYLRQPDDISLKTVYETIVYRDILVRNQLRNPHEILEMLYYLAGNVTQKTTHAALAKLVGIKSPTTVSNYLAAIADTYLVSPLAKYDYSLKAQLRNPRKFYFIDNALVRQLGFRFSDNKGQLLENFVFIELKRRQHTLYYHEGARECDFVVRDGARVTQALQVAYSMDSEATRSRELAGAEEAMAAYGLSESWVITSDRKEDIATPSGAIHIVPAWEWALAPALAPDK